MTKRVLITGANRGIGLGLTEAYLSAGATVLAGVRNPDGARELWELERDYGARIKMVELDVTSDADLARLPETLGDRPLDVLINNAGVFPDALGAAEATAQGMRKAFEVNTLAPLRVTQAALPALRRAHAPLVASITSKMGSIADNGSGGYVAYRMSKTALNMVNACMAHDLKGITCVVLHPGWVETQMGGANAPTKVEESASGIRRVLEGLGPADNGRFLDFRGQEIPW